MEQINPYQTPEAELLTNKDSSEIAPYYVVGNKKTWFLLIGTSGLYAIYWFYKQWNALKQTKGLEVIPFLRAIFNVFFCYSLFQRIYTSKQELSTKKTWNYSLVAVLYILFSIANGASSQLIQVLPKSGAPLLIAIMISGTVFCFWAVANAQKHINHMAEENNWDLNKKITLANTAWCLYGIIMWPMSIFGYIIMLNPEVMNGL